MSTKQRARTAAQDVRGTAKAAVGRVTNDRGLELDGRGDQLVATARKLAHDVVDDLKDAVTSLRGPTSK